MNKDTMMMKTIDQILLHSKALDILRQPNIPYVQATAMIDELWRHYKLESDDYYADDETFVGPARSDEQDLINDDNRERARDMNAVGRSLY